MSSYMPNNDAHLRNWMSNFISYLSTNFPKFGLSEDDVAPLFEQINPQYTTAVDQLNSAKLIIKQAFTARDITKSDLEEAVRLLVNRIQNHPATTDLDRDGLGIPRKDNGNGQGSEELLEITDNKPLAIVDIRQRFRHVLRIQNESTTGTKRAKPKGVRHAEVWVKFDGNPQEDTGFQLLGVATRSPHMIQYDESRGNKAVHYRLRWVNSKGEVSAWSETETATIAA